MQFNDKLDKYKTVEELFRERAKVAPGGRMPELLEAIAAQDGVKRPTVEGDTYWNTETGQLQVCSKGKWLTVTH